MIKHEYFPMPDQVPIPAQPSPPASTPPAPVDNGMTNLAALADREQRILAQQGFVLDDFDEDDHKGFFARLMEYILDFEEEHPFLFFFVTAIILFVIVGAILGFVYGGKMPNIQLPNILPSETNSEDIPEPNQPVVEVANNDPISYNLRGSQEGIKVSTLLLSEEIYDQLLFTGTTGVYLGAHLTNVQQLDQLIGQDIFTKIQTSQNKTMTYEQELTKLKTVTAEASTNFENLEITRTDALTTQKALKIQIKRLKAELQENFAGSGPNQLLTTTESYHDALQEIGEVQANLEILNIAYGAYKKRVPVALARIQAMELNKEALIQGIQFTPVKDSGINLNTNDSVSNNSSGGTTSTNTNTTNSQTTSQQAQNIQKQSAVSNGISSLQQALSSSNQTKNNSSNEQAQSTTNPFKISGTLPGMNSFVKNMSNAPKLRTSSPNQEGSQEVQENTSTQSQKTATSGIPNAPQSQILNNLIHKSRQTQ